jgi:hypothetical protein
LDKVRGTIKIMPGMFAIGSPVQQRLGLLYNIDQIFLDLRTKHG